MYTLNNLAGNLDKVVRSFEHDNRSDTFFRGMAETAKNLSVATDKLTRELNDMKLSSATQRLDSILKKIDTGGGTLGALVNDPELYDSAKSLVGGANRNRIVRNLVRQTIKDNQKKAAEAGQEAKE